MNVQTIAYRDLSTDGWIAIGDSQNQLCWIHLTLFVQAAHGLTARRSLTHSPFLKVMP